MLNHTRPTRIVLVENGDNNLVGGDGDVLTALTQSAPQFSFVLCHVQSEREMFSLSPEKEFDVVLLDLSRSRATDLTAVERIREAFSKIPVITFVENDAEAIRERVLRMGVQEVLLKSKVNCGSLTRTIRNALERTNDGGRKKHNEHLEQALTFLQRDPAMSRSVLPAEPFGLKPLREAMPYRFLELSKSYSNLIELATTHMMRGGVRLYSQSVSRKLNFLASDLGALKAGVRDVLDLHSKALEAQGHETPCNEEERRKIFLELVTDLVSYYRRVDYTNA
jgi:DNA-binding NarL/FixJ family response regulator